MNISKKNSIICLIFLAVIWEVVTRLNTDMGAFIPAFSQIVETLVEEICNFKIIEATYISVVFVVKGYVVSIILAFIVSIICMNCGAVHVLFGTLYKVMSPLPSVAILPVLLLVIGLNESSIILLIVHSVFWPMLASNISGFECIPVVFQEFSNNINLSVIKRYVYVYFPAAFPHIMTGLRTSWGRAWRSLVSAEAIFCISGATQGIGYYIYYHRAYANMEKVFVGIIVICLITLVAEEMFAFVEKNTLKKWGMIR